MTTSTAPALRDRTGDRPGIIEASLPGPSLKVPAMVSRVMIVEDDVDIALVLRYNLEAAGYEVEHIERGDLAILRIAEHAPDLVLLDWMLPGLSGIEVCRRARLLLPMSRLPIIMLSARTERADRDYAFLHGANGFMTKPFALRDVLALTGDLLRPSAGGV